MVIVNNIIYDVQSKEAEVDFKSGDVNINCYCHPVESPNRIHNSTEVFIIAYQVEDVTLDEKGTPKAEKNNSGYYAYNLTGKKISETKIRINDFVIEIGAIPKDIEIGNYVSCHCLRLDYVAM